MYGARARGGRRLLAGGIRTYSLARQSISFHTTVLFYDQLYSYPEGRGGAAVGGPSYHDRHQ